MFMLEALMLGLGATTVGAALGGIAGGPQRGQVPVPIAGQILPALATHFFIAVRPFVLL